MAFMANGMACGNEVIETTTSGLDVLFVVMAIFVSDLYIFYVIEII